MELTDSHFNTFKSFIYQECGIFLHEGKKQLLEARVAKRLRRTGIQSVATYLKKVQSDPHELVEFIDAISTNHTYFFREAHHFEYLQPHHLNIWCAASSSGEEPYSIAVYCLEKGFKPQILATDISTNVLRIGQRGIYPIERAQKVARPVLRRHFQKGHGKSDGYIKLKDDVRQMVTFKRFNLVTDQPPAGPFDVVFCRNVMIYFDKRVKEHVINKLHGVLGPEGYFIIGGAESLNNLSHTYKYVKPSIYQKS
jgi:chemotaxis protein methyltransferase CheR